MLEVDLINAVRGYPCLYDLNIDKTRLIVDMAWKAVARSVGVEEQACRSRWRSIRDRYVKCLRKSEQNHVIVWPLLEHLEFLKEHAIIYNRPSDALVYREKKTTTKRKNSNVSENEISYTEDTQESAEDEMFGAEDKSSNQELNFMFEVTDVVTTPDITKQEYTIQTPEDNFDNSGNIDEDSANNLGHASTTQKRYSNEATETHKKKRKLFLNDLIGSQNTSKLKKTKRNNQDPLTKYDTLIDTLNAYIRQRTKEEEEQSKNEDFFKVLDTYLMKLPDNEQDELMAKILIRVLNKNDAN